MRWGVPRAGTGWELIVHKPEILTSVCCLIVREGPAGLLHREA